MVGENFYPLKKRFEFLNLSIKNRKETIKMLYDYNDKSYYLVVIILIITKPLHTIRTF